MQRSFATDTRAAVEQDDYGATENRHLSSEEAPEIRFHRQWQVVRAP
jgi:hypothetical protein